MTMSPYKKRKVINWGIVGAISGAILSAVLYFVVANEPAYFMFTCFGGALGAGQAYLMPE